MYVCIYFYRACGYTGRQESRRMDAAHPRLPEHESCPQTNAFEPRSAIRVIREDSSVPSLQSFLAQVGGKRGTRSRRLTMRSERTEDTGEEVADLHKRIPRRARSAKSEENQQPREEKTSGYGRQAAASSASLLARPTRASQTSAAPHTDTRTGRAASAEARAWREREIDRARKTDGPRSLHREARMWVEIHSELNGCTEM